MDMYERLLKAMDAAEVAWWEMTLPKGCIEFGKTKTDILGYDSKDFKHYSDFTKLVDPADYEPMMQSMRDHLSGKRDMYEALFRIQAKDGTYKTYYDRGKIVHRNGETIILTGITTNVSAVNGFLYEVSNKPYEPIKPEELKSIGL